MVDTGVVPDGSVLPDIRDPRGATDFLVGIIWNQRMRSDLAWRAPEALRERLGGAGVEVLAAMEPDELAAVIARPPALHPFARAMARYVVGSTALLVERYGGDARALWRGQVDAPTLVSRLLQFPGVGEHKADVAVTLLVLEYDLQLDGGAVRCRRALARCPGLGQRYAGLGDLGPGAPPRRPG